MTRTVTIPVELPADDLPEEAMSVEETAAHLRLLWILDQVRRHNISIGLGARWAGLHRLAFEDLMTRHGIPVFDLSEDEVEAEFDTLERLLASK